MKGLSCFLMIGVLWVVPAAARDAAEDEALASVYSPRGQLRMLGATHTLPTNDIDALMSIIKRHGYNAVMVHGLDDDWGATYPSNYFPFADWRNFEEDTLEALIARCHAEDVAVIVYAPCVMFTKDPRYADIPPEEAAVFDPRAPIEPRNREGKRSASLDSEFRKIFASALKEICAFGADGLWIDGFSMEESNRVGEPWAHGAEPFREETGLDWPMREDWESDAFRRWVRWRYDRHMANGAWIAEQVRSEYPNVSLSFNTHFVTPLVSEPGEGSYAPLSWIRWREAVPLSRFPAVIGASNHARLMPSNPAQSTPFWLSMSSDMNPLRCDLWQPTFAEVTRIPLWNLNVPSDGLGLRMSGLAALTYGCQIWFEGNVHTGNGVGTEMYTDINETIAAREPWFGGDRMPYCGVVLSNNTRDYWGVRQRRDNDVRNTDRLFTESFFGLTSLLMANQVQYSHLFDNTLTADELARFQVVLLPNVACLSDAACEALRSYVEEGGRLIATYETSLYDEWGNRRPDFALSGLLGVAYKDTLHKMALEPPHWSRTLSEPALNGDEPGFTWQTRRTVIEALPGAEVLARETGVAYPAAKDKRLEGTPVIVRNRVGEGEATYICDDLTQGYYQAPYRTIPRILVSLIEQSPPPVRVEAPPQVIANTFSQQEGRRLVVHLLNMPPMTTRLFERSQRDTLDSIQPVQDIRVHLRGNTPPARTCLEPGGIVLDGELMDGIYTVAVPELREHAMVVVDWERASE